jgi:hypothetical protein
MATNILSVALTKGWDIHKYLSKSVILKMLFILNLDYVFRFKKALFGLKQAPRALFDQLSGFILTLGFYCSTASPYGAVW